jgi:hypothetical protein
MPSDQFLQISKLGAKQRFQVKPLFIENVSECKLAGFLTFFFLLISSEGDTRLQNFSQLGVLGRSDVHKFAVK